MIAHFAQSFSAGLKSLFNAYSDAFNARPRFFADADKAFDRGAVSEKIVDNQNVIVCCNVFF